LKVIMLQLAPNSLSHSLFFKLIFMFGKILTIDYVLV
jgi:hypothetical protein